MWSKITALLSEHPERLSVARVLLEHGLAVRSEKIFCNEIEIPAAKVARVAGVDRRTVVETIRMVERSRDLSAIFRGIRSAGTSLREVAKELGFGVVEILPNDPRSVGILAGAAQAVARRNISIRQALVDDPELHPQPKLALILEGKVPSEIVAEILKVPGVEKVTVS